MKRLLEAHSALLFGVLLFFCAAFAHSQVSPFMGIGNVQFVDNNGNPLTSGVLYSYQAGTTTQQATFTDYTGLISNPNPIPFGSGARVSIWLTTSNTYKFVLCSQNDGATCAPADVLFSVDQVPGGPTSSGGGSSGTFTGNLVSGSSTPATSGVVRLASGDAICFRNAASSANLCITKDSSDVLAWANTTIKLPEGSCSSSGATFDYLCAGSANHRLNESANGGLYYQIVLASSDINNADQVIQFHFGATATPLSGSAPTTNQYLQWNGTNIVGQSPETSWTAYLNTIAASTTAPLAQSVLTRAHTLVRIGAAMLQSPVTCATPAVVSLVDSTASSNVGSLTLANGSITDDSGVLNAAMTAGHTFQISVTTGYAGCATAPSQINITVVYQ